MSNNNSTCTCIGRLYCHKQVVRFHFIVLCRELDSDSEDQKSTYEDPLAGIPMTNFAELDFTGNEVSLLKIGLGLQSD